jgi:ribosomal-protein-alanine acetyltransferase
MFDQKPGTVAQRGAADSPAPERRVIVRPFTPSDLEEITRIEDASFPVDAFPEAEFKRLHSAYPHEFLVADMSGDVVGYVTGSVVADRGEIESIAVDEGARGRGIGALLVRRLLERFQQIGLRRCVLEVRTTNAVAIDLYERLGFRVVGTRPAYYTNGSDAFLMEKTLGGDPARADGAECD